MARTFTAASSEDIVTSLGALGFAFGPGTIAAICKRASDGATQCVFRGGSTSSTRYDLLVASTDLLRLFLNNSGISASTLKLLAADGWCLIAATKATGTATPRFHKYQYSNDTHTHENGTSTLANSGTAGTRGTIGSQQGTGNWNGDLAVVGVWNVVLTDAQVEMLPFNLAAWYAPAQPKGLWVLDQDVVTQKVVDLSGGGATESSRTGTTVSTNSVPVWNYGHNILRVERIFQKVLAAAGALTPSSTIVDNVAKALSGAVTPTGTPANRSGKPLVGTLTPSGVLATAKLFILAVAGTLAPVGALVQASRKAAAGALTPAGAAVSAIGKATAGAMGAAGSVRNAAAKTAAGTITPASELAKRVGKTLAGLLAPVGALATEVVSGATIALAGVITPAGSLSKTAAKAVQGALAPAGATVAAVFRTLAGTLEPIGTVAKTAAQSLAGAITPTGAANVALAFIGGIVGRIIHRFTAGHIDHGQDGNRGNEQAGHIEPGHAGRTER